MTLGNDPQPLTRRQIREAALAQAPAPVSVEPVSPTDASPVAKPTADAPEPTTDAAKPPTKAAKAKAAKSEAAAAAASVAPTDAASTTAERALTRRELRAQSTAEFALEELALEAEATTLASAETEGPAALNPPVGHWSVDREEDATLTQSIDRPFEQLMAQGLGSGGIPTTTNALILPSAPNNGSNANPIINTGEILITGSFDLPRSLGATGQHPNHFDSADVDHMLDELDEGPVGDSAPVSASRAVSTHASTRGVLTPPKRRGASLPIVLSVTAAALAIGVLALFVAGYLFNVF